MVEPFRLLAKSLQAGKHLFGVGRQMPDVHTAGVVNGVDDGRVRAAQRHFTATRVAVGAMPSASKELMANPRPVPP